VSCPDHQCANTEQNSCLLKGVGFLAYEDPLGVSLACMALCFSALSAIIFGVFMDNQETPTVKFNNQPFSFILLISLT
jgi:hypothetical protein